ncbi:MAG: hypothetical protein V4678_04795 [Patescibacteria group bacterium]
MKITQTNESELVVQTSGISGLIAGVVFALVGVGVALYPSFASVEWWVSAIGLVVAGIGGALIFTASSTRTALRRPGTSSIVEKRLVGGATKEATFESSQIAQIRLESHTEYDTSSSSESNNRSGQQQRQRVSNLYVVLHDGTEITVGSKRVNGNGGFAINGIGLSSVSKAPLSAEAKQIADFFGVPLKTGIQDANLQDVVGAVQTAFTKPATPVVIPATAQTEIISPAPLPTPATTTPAPGQPTNPTNPQV